MKLLRPYPIGLAFTLALGPVWSVLAQTPPESGQTLQQTQPPVLKTPMPSQGIIVQPAPASLTQPGGLAVLINSLSFSGNTVFTQAQLQAALGDVVDKTYDLAGLQDLAERVSQHYHASGYPFTRAFLSAQPMALGLLRIDVVEGQYGQVTTTGDAALATQAQGFLSALHPGDVIQSTPLFQFHIDSAIIWSLKYLGFRYGQNFTRGRSCR